MKYAYEVWKALSSGARNTNMFQAPDLISLIPARSFVVVGN